MNQIVIGSVAMRHHFPDFPREPHDLDIAVIADDVLFRGDYIVDVLAKEEYASGLRVEKLLTTPIFNYIKDADGVYAPPEILLTLKMSHLFWNINWDKHMWDVQFLLKKGVKYDKKLFYELYDFWNELHGKNTRSDLKMTAEEFFDNALTEFDHDHLHTLINPSPTYISMLKDGEEVDIDEDKFNNASDTDKKNLIREEVYVMAMERFRKLNVPKVYLHKHAYSRMMKKYIVSHVPMFVFFYLIENYIELSRPEYDFIKVIEEKL